MNSWATGRALRRSRVDTRASLAKRECECLETSITWGEYENAKNETVWLRMVRHQLLEGAGRNGRQKRVGRLRAQDNISTERQIEPLRSDNWATRAELRRSKAEAETLILHEGARSSRHSVQISGANKIVKC